MSWTGKQRNVLDFTLSSLLRRQGRNGAAVKARLWGYYYEPLNGANYTVIADENFPYGKRTVVIGNGVARHLPPLVGKTIPMRSYGGSYLFMRIPETQSRRAH